jgi:citrate lyase subunit beta/citryl-CoA lyase
MSDDSAGTGHDAASSAGSGEAGRRGEDVRSDLFVSVEVREGGGIEVALTSKVGTLYSSSIRDTVQATARRLGVADASIQVEDQGALPFVIAARVETAFRRAGVEGGDGRPEATVRPGPGTARDRLRRSRLYLPGNESKFMINAGLHRPDGVILDLEDSVHPTEKDAARILVRNALRAVDFGEAERMVRINQLPLGLEDLDTIVPEAPDLILIPKAESADQVTEVSERIRHVLAEVGIEKTIWLMPIVESALGVEHAFAIASATESVASLTIGLEDYTADLGVRRTAEGDEVLYARQRIVNAAHAAGVQASDSVFSDVADVEGLRAWGTHSREMGFEGMGCIHPRQIEPIHKAFAPPEAEIQKALRIVEAFRDAEARGLGVVSLGSKMIDRPVVLRALRLVEIARQAGILPASGEDPDAEGGEVNRE